jgi:signal recognition particle subunit SRP54
MLAGLQGTGKTTLAGKLGLWLKQNGHSPMLVAADLQRPNAVTQLQVVGDRAGVPVWAPEPGSGVGDPVQVARSGLDEARRRLYDVVVVDTAGRLGVDAEMMRQAADIRDAVQPDEILFVLDAMVGQDAVTTALAFLEGVGFDGVVLTKLDGDARGGAALSVRSVTGRPVMFASNGERLEDFDAFHPERMASRILGMGDMLTLIEQAERAFDAEQAEQMAAKLQQGTDFGLDDFLQQLQAVRRMGPLTKIFGMLPGANQFKDALDSFDEREVDRVEAVIRSMTPAERADPKILNASRRARIAQGSGTSVSDVNQLVERFFVARDMMSQAARGVMPSLPGMPGSGGKKSKGRAQKAQDPRRGGGRGARSGNPAKRAAQVAEAEQRRQGAPSPVLGSADDLAALELPSEFRDLLPPR